MDRVGEIEEELRWARRSRDVLRSLTRAIASIDRAPALFAALSERIGAALGVDRSLIYDVDLARQVVVGQSEWLNPGAPGVTPTLAIYPLDAFRAGAEWMWHRRRALESHADDPAAVLRGDGSADVLHGAMAIESLLWFPFAFRSGGYHLLVFNQVSRRRAWTDAERELIGDASLQVEVALGKLGVLADRVAALDAAERTAAHLAALVATSTTGVLFETDAREVQVANARFCELLSLGASPAALVGADCHAAARTSAPLFVEPGLFLRRTEAIIEAGEPVTGEELACVDGRVLERDYVRVGAPGPANGHLWLYRDVTAQRREKERLRQLERAIEQSPMGVIVTDLDGVIVFVNERFSRISGFTRQEAIGQKPRILRSPNADPRVYAELWGAISSGREWAGELVNRHRNGEPVPIRLVVSPVFDAHRRITHYVGVQEDLREQARAADALEAADERLRLAQKMEAVSRFASGVAHDFNNLLSVILTYTNLSLEGLRSDDPMSKDLAQVQGAAERAATLTRRLLAFSRRETLEAKAVGLNEVLGELDRVLRRLLGEDVELVIEPSESVGAVFVDPGQLEQSILNLASNARDAMPDGGTLTLSTALVTVPGPSPMRGDVLDPPSELAPGAYAVLTVTDTGVGMDEPTVARIFEPFFTTKEVGKGTGLGLALVHGFTRQSGGAVTVASHPGEGATFALWLPRHASSVPVVASASAIAGERAGRQEVVLVIEDEPDIRRLARRILTRAGYRAAVAANGGEALLWCEQHGASVRLLVCDVVMPGIRGPDLIRRLAPLCPAAKVLFMSGYPEGMRDALPVDAELLAKPFDVRTLLSRVRERLDT